MNLKVPSFVVETITNHVGMLMWKPSNLKSNQGKDCSWIDLYINLFKS